MDWYIELGGCPLVTVIGVVSSSSEVRHGDRGLAQYPWLSSFNGAVVAVHSFQDQDQ